MEKKIKIKISEQAYNKLLHYLKDNGDNYSHIRFKYKSGCPKSSKIDIYMDNIKEGDIQDKIDDLSILYDTELCENIKEITLVYRKSSFMVKSASDKESFKGCSSCSHGCSHGCTQSTVLEIDGSHKK